MLIVISIFGKETVVTNDLYISKQFEQNANLIFLHAFFLRNTIQRESCIQLKQTA